MTTYVEQRFTDQHVILDGHAFERCVFERCTLEFRGLRSVHLADNALVDCHWQFKGPAGNALQFLSALHHSGSEGAALVAATFAMVRGQSPAAAFESAMPPPGTDSGGGSRVLN